MTRWNDDRNTAMTDGPFEPTLDSLLNDLAVPAGLLPRLREIAELSDDELDVRLRDVGVPAGLVERLQWLVADEALDAELRRVSIPVSVLPRTRIIPHVRRRSRAASVGAGSQSDDHGWRRPDGSAGQHGVLDPPRPTTAVGDGCDRSRAPRPGRSRRTCGGDPSRSGRRSCAARRDGAERRNHASADDVRPATTRSGRPVGGGHPEGLEPVGQLAVDALGSLGVCARCRCGVARVDRVDGPGRRKAWKRRWFAATTASSCTAAESNRRRSRRSTRRRWVWTSRWPLERTAWTESAAWRRRAACRRRSRSESRISLRRSNLTAASRPSRERWRSARPGDRPYSIGRRPDCSRSASNPGCIGNAACPPPTWSWRSTRPRA